MALVVLFAGCVLLVLLAAHTPARTVLSAPLVLLVAGAVAIRLGWVSLRPDSPVVDGVVSVALFASTAPRTT